MPSRRPRQRVDDILENIGRIERYVATLSESEFLGNTEKLDAVERCLLRISEAAAKLGDAASELMPDQPWTDIRSFGNVLRHEYDNIDAATVMADHPSGSSSAESRPP